MPLVFYGRIGITAATAILWMQFGGKRKKIPKLFILISKNTYKPGKTTSQQFA